MNDPCPTSATPEPYHAVEAAELRSAVALAHRLAVLGETDPMHPTIIAVRGALEIVDARRAQHRATREAGHDVHGGDVGYWRRVAANHVPHAELVRRRAVPGQIRRTGVPAA